MTTRSAIGAVTLIDVSDGIHPIAAVLGNQSHTFAADQAGTVVNSEISAFACEVFLYVGDSRATYDPSLSTNQTPGTYSINRVDSSGWVSNTTTTNNQAVVGLTTIPSGTTSLTGTVTLAITVCNSIGVVIPDAVTLVISLNKAIAGADGTIVTLTPNRVFFRFDETGTTTDSDIVLNINTIGSVGTLSAQYNVNGGVWSTLSAGTGANSAKVLDIDNAGGDDNITLSAANFGTADTFTVRVSGSTSGQDTVSIVRVQKGDTGNHALHVSISSSVNGFSFRNNQGSNKTLTAKVVDMGDNSDVSSSCTYQWYKDGVLLAGQTTKTLVVTASDVEDGSSNEFSVNAVHSA